MKPYSFFIRRIAACALALASVAPALAAPAGPAYTAQEQTSLKAYAGHFKAIRNQAQLLAAYREALKLSKQLDPRYEKFMEALGGEVPSDAQLATIKASVPGLVPQLVAEGTMLTLYQDFAAYGAAAARTPEKADDAFFALMKQAYGDQYHHFGAWFQQTWDYGGCTWLGKGKHRQLLQGIQKLRAAKSPFGPELKVLEGELLGDLEQSGKFCQPKAQVLQEFQQVLPLVPAARKPALQKRLQQLQKGTGIEYDCEGKGNCSYG